MAWLRVAGGGGRFCGGGRQPKASHLPTPPTPLRAMGTPHDEEKKSEEEEEEKEEEEEGKKDE